MYHIIDKHWSILSEDPLVGEFVTLTQSITFKRANSIRDNVVKREYKGERRKDPCKDMGTFPRGSCAQCTYIKREKEFVLPNVEKYKTMSKHLQSMRIGNLYLPVGRHVA